MRVNPDFVPQILSSIWSAQEQEQKALLEVSTGKRVNVPSDDPGASAALVHNQAAISYNDQYQANTSTVEGMLQTADSTLSSVVTSLNQAISLGVQGATDTVSFENQQQIATQVQGIRDQILQLANVTYQGLYLFGGTATNKAPFSLDASGAVQYDGNQGINHVEIADGRSIQTNLPGTSLFMGGSAGDVMSSLQTLTTALQSGDNAAISDATTKVRGAFDYLSQQRVFYGNSLKQLDANQTFLQQEKLSLQSQQNDLVGIDFAEAATNLVQAQNAHQAALAAAARSVPQTLLDYLK